MHNIKDLSIVSGEYRELDTRILHVIKQEERFRIIHLIESIIEEERNTMMNRYQQGYLPIKSSNDLYALNNCLEDFYNIVLKDIYQLESIQNILKECKKEMYMRNPNVECIESLIERICAKIEAKVLLMNFPKTGDFILKIKQPNLYIIIGLSDNVKTVLFDEKPNYIFMEGLAHKNIPFIISDEDLIEGNTYHIDLCQHTIGSSYCNIENHADSKQNEKGNFQLGLEIHSEKMIQQSRFHQPDFILVEPEKSYLDSEGLILQKEREDFYRTLYEAYPNTEIIVSLPRIDILNAYHQINDDFMIDEAQIAKHYEMYSNEIESIFVEHHEKLKISIPSVACDKQFKMLKHQIKELIQKQYNRHMKIGLNIETETTFEFIDYYKKYDFALINIERLFEEICEKDDKVEFFTKELSWIGQRLKIKSKDTYLTGASIHHQSYFCKLVTRGFRRFVVNYRHFKTYEEIIQKHNESRGKYSKFKE